MFVNGKSSWHMSIERAYDSWANQYDTNQNKTRDLDSLATIKTLEKYDFDSVVELGCGTGKNTEYLLTRAKRIIGLDFSAEMLAKAKQKIQNNRVVFQKADLTREWELQNEVADLITSSLTLEHIQNLNFIFQQAQLKLKPGGIFFISELHPFKQYQGSKAKYQTSDGTIELETYAHHVSDFTSAAHSYNFQLLELSEWFDEVAENEIPRLISFVFRKG